MCQELLMKNLFGYSRVLAVGDIHGMHEKLITLMDKIRFAPEEDLLVFLGDYIDRGPDSVKCLQYVYDLQHRNPDSVVCLMGNHEVMLSSYLIEKRGIYNTLIGDYSESWLENGGFQTLQQLKETDAKKREELLAWVTDLPVKYQYQEFFFCHAGIDPDVPLSVQNEYDMLWRRRKWWEQYRGAETIVAGHTPIQKIKKGTRSVKPLFLPNRVILCDTGAYMAGGKLSGVDVLSRKVWQT